MAHLDIHDSNRPEQQPSSQESVDSVPTRIIIRACVTDVPGDPLRRATTLGEIFAGQVLGRPLRRLPHVTEYDGVHFLPDYSSEQPVRRWFMYDLNVRCRLSKDELLAIPYRVYLASLIDDRWIFTAKNGWADKARTMCNDYYWGGRSEQTMVDEMRLSINPEIEKSDHNSAVNS